MAKKRGKRAVRNFDPNEAFFIIDSDNLKNVKSELYGFCIVNDTITDKVEALAEADPSGGVYVYVKRDADTITIKQDSVGAYGIFLYRDNDYFALSNSFIRLVDYVKIRHKITFNKEYADYIITAGLCSEIYLETMINEITLLDRTAVVELSVPKKAISWYYIDYKENTVDLDSAEGMRILDNWYKRWTGIVKSLFDNGEDILFDLSGGFDSRMTFLLAIGSGIDLNKIYVKSTDDNLHTHSEDYEIASQIAEYFGFTLNNDENLSSESDRYSVEDVLNMCWYLQGCFHKETYFHYNHFKKSRYAFTGYGGECVREYNTWRGNRQSFCEHNVKLTMKYPFADPVQIKGSLESISGRTFDKFNDRLKTVENAPTPADPSAFALALYRETRNKIHFGELMTGCYYSNIFALSPLLDTDLQRLKLYVSQDQSDRNVLCAILFDRYCSKLLDFKFDSKRSLKDTTIENAKAVNKAFPYVEQPVEMHIKTDLRDISMRKIEKVPSDVPDKLLMDAFCTDEIKNLFLEKYNEEVYSYVLEDSKKRFYFP